LAEFGPYYDSPNEDVIPTVQNTAAPRLCAGFTAAVTQSLTPLCAAISVARFGAEEGLVAGPFWRDHEISMTRAGCNAGPRKT
jgi:hypothetical protein